MASRYLATVRRAISMPVARKRSTMVSSERISAGSSASISCLMWWRTASAEWASPRSADAMEAVKKYFNSNMPRLVAMYLLAVTRETVDSCIWMASATAFRLSGRKWATPCVKKPSCWRTISVATFRMGRGRCLQAIAEIGFVAVLADRLRQLGVIALVDQHARQRVAVEFDVPAAIGA